MAPVEIAGLEVRYANLNSNPVHSAGLRASRKLEEDHKRRVARLVNKEHVLPTWWALSRFVTVCRGVVDVGEKATMHVIAVLYLRVFRWGSVYVV